MPSLVAGFHKCKSVPVHDEGIKCLMKNAPPYLAWWCSELSLVDGPKKPSESTAPPGHLYLYELLQ